jgi:ribonuclease HII
MPDQLWPSFEQEEMLQATGHHYIAGIDEAGRGSLAGPVVAAAVILPPGLKASWLTLVRDSKLLTAAKREYVYSYIQEKSISVAIGVVSHRYIDRHNILKATHLAMKTAVKQLDPPPDSLLIDYLTLPRLALPQRGITNGDALCISIACASIIAKVSRDRLMADMDARYSGYGLSHNKGYWTKRHLQGLLKLGPSAIHRRSFDPVRSLFCYVK